MMTHAMNCDAVDERLADYLEGELTASDERAVEAHVASCVRCTALVRDLEGIRASASMLPELAPSRELWQGIAERIDAPVIPFVTAKVASAAASQRHHSFSRMRLAAIAAALVAVTAGVTYTLTIAGANAGNQDRQTAGVIQPAPNAPTDTNAASVINAPTSDVAANIDSARQADAVNPTASTTQNVRNAPAPVTSSGEIDRLRDVFTRNRNQLDPRTAAIIEANLKVIDEAIAQSRAALLQDPASQFLKEQLNGALDKKLELLRTAALLPQRT
jgi:anti-sigma factor RsiW